MGYFEIIVPVLTPGFMLLFFEVSCCVGVCDRCSPVLRLTALCAWGVCMVCRACSVTQSVSPTKRSQNVAWYVQLA